MYKNFISAAVALILVCAMTACTSNAKRPDTLAIQARESVKKAESVGAEEKAPLALRDASQYLSEAEQAMEEEEYREAQRLLEKSMINSELAIARSNASSAKKAAEEIEKNLETLQDETLQGEIKPNSQSNNYSYD